VFHEHGEEGLRSLKVGKNRSIKMADNPEAVEAALERSKERQIQELEKLSSLSCGYFISKS
jgi:transposase